jgi:hypothetical protein
VESYSEAAGMESRAGRASSYQKWRRESGGA